MGQFMQYNYYDAATMIERYGPGHPMTPPLIPVENIPKAKVPIAMFVGAQDTLANVQDCELLKEKLGPDTVVKFKILENFDHSSFNLYKDEDQGFI